MSRREEDEHRLSDLELIRRCSKGEIRAQEILYKRYFSFAMSICSRYANNQSEAMEIVNDSYMKALDNIEGFKGTSPFKTWYGRILVNTAIDNYRRKTTHEKYIQLNFPETTVEIEPAVDAELSANDILSLFSQIPVNYKITFNLFEIEGYTHEEIGKMLGISTSTSRSNLVRAKKMLRVLYRKNFNPEKRTNEAI